MVVTQTRVRRARLRPGRGAAGTARGSSPPGGSPPTGPGIFGPTHGSAPDIAGQGVANPSGMLLAAALMLSEGLGERAAATHARAGGLARARRRRAHAPTSTAPARRRRRATSCDAVLELMPSRAHGPSLDGGATRDGAERMNGADAVLRSLEAEGVDVVFGLPGGAILPIYDALARGTTRPPRARPPRAGRRATWPRATRGRPAGAGVAFATSGPGATNLVTPIADAWMDSTPLVCVTGQVRSHLIGTDAFQECDIVGVTTPIVKHSWLVQDVEEIPHVMKAAFHVARTGRCGPVLVDIPRDVQEAELDFSYPDEVDLPGWRPPTRGHARQIAEAARRIAAAERPVLYVGGGTLNADACAELLDARRGRPRARGHDADGEGRLPGDARAPLRLARHARAEVVEPGDEHVRPARRRRRPLRRPRHRQARRVRPRRDASSTSTSTPPRSSKLRRADVPVVGPLKQVLADLATQLRRCRRRAATPSRGCARSRRGARSSRSATATAATRSSRRRCSRRCSDLTAGRDDVIWTTGVGQHQMWAMQYLLCDRPRSFITSGGLGTMGYGVPAAVGAKAARPDATVVCVDGDGCFQMTGQELATAVLEDLPIVTVIVNNGYLGMVQQWQTMFFEERRSHVHLTHAVPDYAALARGLRRRGVHRRGRERARAGARRGARLRPHGGRRRARRPARAVLPDDPGRRRRARACSSTRSRRGRGGGPR